MKIIGAQVKYEIGNRTECVIFDEVFRCMSLKDKAVVTEYRGISRKVEPGEEIMCPKVFIDWALTDPMSPFARDGSFVVSWDDKPLNADAARQKIADVNALKKHEATIPDGLPEKEWRPRQLMDLYRALEPKEIPEQQFIVASPPSKARILREYMVKKHITVKGGAIIKEASAA